MFQTRITRLLTGLLLAGLLGHGAGAAEDAPVRSGCEYDYPPFCIVSTQQVASGFSVELLRAALGAMGREVTFKTAPWAELKEDLARGRLQVLPLVARTPEREAQYDFTAPYLSIHATIVVREKDPRIRAADDLAGMRVAVLEGDAMEEYVRRTRLTDKILPHPTLTTALQALSAGTCDAVIIPRLLFAHLASQYGLTGLVCLNAPLTGYVQKLCFAVPEGEKELLATLNEGLAIVQADETFRQLYDKWFSPSLLPRFGERHRVLIGGSPHLPPYEFLDPNGQPAGLNVDVIHAIASHLGVQVDIRLAPWQKTQENLQAGDLDMIQSMAYSADRDKALQFSLPHHYADAVLITRQETPEYRSMQELTNRMVLVRRGDLLETLARQAGLTKLIPTDTMEEALRRLARGEGVCALGDRIAALAMIREHGWENLKAGKVPIVRKEYCLAAKAENHDLLTRFEEGLAAIEKSGQLRAIREKWLTPYEKPAMGVREAIGILLWIVGPLLLILGGALLWNRALQRQIVRKTAELQASENRFRSFMDNCPAIAWAKDEAGRHVYLNRSYETRFGVRLADWQGKTDADLWPAEIARTFRENDLAVLEQNRPMEVEEQTVNPDGSRCTWLNFKFPFQGGDGSRYVGGFGVDVTARRQAEEALRQSEEKFRSIVESSPTGIHLYRLEADGRLILTGGNPAAVRILGIQHADLQGKTIEEAFPKLVGTEIPALYKRVASGELGTQAIEIPYADERMSGVYDVRVFRTGPGAIVASFLNISDRKRLEEQLRQSEKMQAIGQLAGGVAHDFNNQLGGIMGFAELLADKLTDPALNDYAVKILKGATRAAELTRQLLAFSRKGKYLNQPTDLNQIIREVAELLSRSIDKRIELRQELSDAPATVLADPTQIQNAILNLGLNARDAMPEGGTLTFATDRLTIAEPLPSEELEPGAYVRIRVTDTGVGMEAATMKRLFEPFFTTKGVGKGTGLGLASAYGTAKNHGGTIRVTSEPGHGSTFQILLPLYAGAPCAAGGEEQAAPPAHTAPARQARILLVDDEPLILDLGRAMLSKHGYDVVTCQDAQAALELYHREWRSVNLVILDMVMPRMGARELFLAMRAINPRIRAVLSSGFTIDGEAQTILDLGMMDFVQKPFRMADLLQTVARVLPGKNSRSRASS